MIEERRLKNTVIFSKMFKDLYCPEIILWQLYWFFAVRANLYDQNSWKRTCVGLIQFRHCAYLTLSWRRLLSYRNQSIDLLWKTTLEIIIRSYNVQRRFWDTVKHLRWNFLAKIFNDKSTKSHLLFSSK